MDAGFPPLGPPPPDVSRGHILVIASCVLHCVSLPIVATRLWSRIKPTAHLWWDDWTILVAVAFDLINWILVLIACQHGFGRPSLYVPPADAYTARLCQYFAQHASGWALGFGKVSVALMLFRLRRDQATWRWFLRGMMVWALVIAVTCSGTLFAVCTPVRAMWDFSLFPGAKCQAFADINRGILAVAAMTVITDFILALLPLSFVFQLQRSLRERITVSFVMALGIVASVASICKIAEVANQTKLTGDGLVDGVNVTFWGILEIQLGIIAACVPCLKRLAETWLRRVGLISTQKTQPTYYGDQTSRKKRTVNSSAIQRRDDTVVEFDEVPIVQMTPHSSKNKLSDDERRYEAWSVVDSKA